MVANVFTWMVLKAETKKKKKKKNITMQKLLENIRKMGLQINENK